MVSYRPGVTIAIRRCSVGLRLYSPKRLELLRFLYPSIISLNSCQSHRMLAIIDSAASQPLSQNFNRSIPSRQSGMVQPVVQVKKSSRPCTPPIRLSWLLGFFSSCSTFDSA
eukprot:scaffold25689_cov118-Isochrysis_galbana.AAC.1